jgi:hypothetical protein
MIHIKLDPSKEKKLLRLYMNGSEVYEEEIFRN